MTSLALILERYRAHPGLGPVHGAPRIEEVRSDGFSGARIWKIITPADCFALKRWPAEHPSDDRLNFIHGVLRHVRRQGTPPIAAPLEDDRHRTWSSHDGYRWELAPWLAGAADYRVAPSPERLAAAMRGLAEFHRATAEIGTRPGHSPGLAHRLELLERAAEIVRAWRESSPDFPGADIHRLAGQLVARLDAPWDAHEDWRSALRQSAARTYSLQPCLRDVWHAHVMFDGSRFTGFIDFGSVDWEHPAADIGRLLGSMVDDDPEGWRVGLNAYEDARPLTDADHRLSRLFDAANARLSVLNWIDWIYIQRRWFDDWRAVTWRLTELGERVRI